MPKSKQAHDVSSHPVFGCMLSAKCTCIHLTRNGEIVLQLLSDVVQNGTEIFCSAR